MVKVKKDECPDEIRIFIGNDPSEGIFANEEEIKQYKKDHREDIEGNV